MMDTRGAILVRRIRSARVHEAAPPAAEQLIPPAAAPTAPTSFRELVRERPALVAAAGVALLAVPVSAILTRSSSDDHEEAVPDWLAGPGAAASLPSTGPEPVAALGPPPAGFRASPFPTDVTDSVVAEVTASSFLERHPPSDAFDGRAGTAWNEGVPGPGVGEWIEARFVRRVRVAHLTITPGWDFVMPRTGRDLFTANRYLTRFDVEHDGGARSFEVPDGLRLFRADLGGASTSRIRVVARAVQPGPVVYEDLCIGDVRIFEASSQ